LDNKIQNKIKSKWKVIYLYPIAIILLFEEWGWTYLAKLVEKMTRLSFLKKMEIQLVSLPSWGVLLVFIFPILLLLPIKIFILYLLGKGHVITGMLLLIISKLFGTAFFARLFEISKSNLMSIEWFSIWYPRWKLWKDRILSEIRKSEVWRILCQKKLQIKSWVLNINHHRN